MATILTQQTDPFGVVAANLAGSLIQNMIQRSQEANQNRKMNALINEVMNANQAQNQGLMQNINAVPEGYNVDPWAAAMHKNYSPMTQFNMGIADSVTPFAQQGAPTIQDLRNAVASNLGTKRFSMLDPAMVEKMMDPYYQQAQKAQQDALRKEYADKFMNAENAADRRNIAWGGAIQDPSVVPFDFLQEAQRQYQYGTPSASDIMNNDYRNRQFDEGVRQFDANNRFKYDKMAQDNEHFYSDQEYNRGKDAQVQSNWDKTYEAGREDANRNYGLKEREFESGVEQQKWLREQTEKTNAAQEVENKLKNWKYEEEALTQEIR